MLIDLADAKEMEFEVNIRSRCPDLGESEVGDRRRMEQEQTLKDPTQGHKRKFTKKMP